jgi:glutamyl-Q tRNA(Asp) synthetase
MSDFVTRFAPSPTGLLHLGHAYSALTAYRAARSAGGRFLLRLEDIDRSRCRPEFETAIFEDLDWLGVAWDGGVRRQSEHFADYAATLEALASRGLVYRCFKTRKEVLDDIARAPHFGDDGGEPVYFGGPLPPDQESSLLAAGAPFAWRLSTGAAKEALGGRFRQLSFFEEDRAGGRRRVDVEALLLGDAVLARKDGGPSYHLACVHDDALQGVTHVIRGEDLRPVAHLHRLLQALLDLPTPVYRHHPLIKDEAGRRLAKRDRAATLRALRQSGVPAAEVRRRLGFAGVVGEM